MSAIAGLVRLGQVPLAPDWLGAMQASLAPYGRDAQAHWAGPDAGLVRTLLAITPEDALDRQPLAGRGGLRWVFDGRLDNRQALAEALAIDRPALARLADSEVALRAWERWDVDALPRLAGDFALACWQPERRRLVLARDAMGGRPLFWARTDALFAFASLPKALFPIPGVGRALCESQVLETLTLQPTRGAQTLYEGVWRVEPGHYVVLEDGQVSSHRYFCFDPQREIRFSRDEDYLEAFSEQLERAVGRCLRTSGGVASQLSSGFDSSTVTLLAARQMKTQTLHAYTAVPAVEVPALPGRHNDEGPLAALTARRFPNIEHHLIRSGHLSPLAFVRADIEAMDGPARNPCNQVWLRAIQADAERRGARVLLCGQFGNAGISYNGAQLLPALWQQRRWLRWALAALRYKRALRASSWRAIVKSSVLPSLPPALQAHLRPPAGDVTDYCAVNPACRLPERAIEPLKQGRAWRIDLYQRNDVGQVGAAANLHGLELRDPTRDPQLLAFCLALPEDVFVRDGHPRWPLRRLMAGVLPREVLEATRKGRQAMDWHVGLEADLARVREELALLERSEMACRLLDVPALRQLVEAWPGTGPGTARFERDYRLKLLRGLAMGIFIAGHG